MRAWAAAAAVALLAATGPGLAPRSPAAWRPLFAADFSDPLVPPECAPFDAPHTAPAASYYRPDEVRVAGGVLHLSLRRRDFGGRPYTSGGIGCVRLAQTYGRYEFHAKVPPGAGLNSYLTLTADSDDQPTRVEILARPGDERLYLTNGGTSVASPGGYSAAFHTYAVEWTPDGVRVDVDGEPRLSDRHSPTRPRWVGFAVSTGDARTGRPAAGTALPAEFVVDWVRVYAYGASDAAVPPVARGHTDGGGHALVWLAVAAAAAALLLVPVGYARTRRRRRWPPPGHRA